MKQYGKVAKPLTGLYVLGMLLDLSLMIPVLFEGSFNARKLIWKPDMDQRSTLQVAAIPQDSLSRFLEGEEARGDTKLEHHDNLMSNSNDRSNIVNARYSCKYGPEHDKDRQEERGQLQTQIVTGVRTTKAAEGTSCKRNRVYAFTVKRFVRRPDALIVKFTCTIKERSGHCCFSMAHIRDSHGEPARVGRRDHHEYTVEVQQMVLLMLNSQCSIAVTKTGAYTGMKCVAVSMQFIGTWYVEEY